MSFMKNFNPVEYQYQSYLSDIDIAIEAIKDSLLYPSDGILFDLYAIPSHNHQAYYAIVCKEKTGYEMTYARTEIYDMNFEEPIKMYQFSWAKVAQEHSARDGRIIVGITMVSEEFVKLLNEVSDSVVDGDYCSKIIGRLDGYFQVIRFWHEEKIIKQIAYDDPDLILIKDGRKDIKDFLDNLYVSVEGFIDRNDNIVIINR